MAELEFAAEITTTVPDRLPVYAMRRPAVTQRVLADLARSLGLPALSKGAELTAGESWLRLQDGPHVLVLHTPSGAFSYQDRRAWNVNENMRFELDDDQAVDIARSFVRRTRLVLEWRSPLSGGGVTHLRMPGAPPGRE